MPPSQAAVMMGTGSIGACGCEIQSSFHFAFKTLYQLSHTIARAARAHHAHMSL